MSEVEEVVLSLGGGEEEGGELTVYLDSHLNQAADDVSLGGR